MPDQHEWSIVLTCEHGSNRVPPLYEHLFRDAHQVLETHRAFDIGALDIAGYLAANLAAPLFAATTTRLLIELNRSLNHPHLFSEFTRGLPQQEHQQLIHNHYLPYRKAVTRHISDQLRLERNVIHVSVHSFTDILEHSKRDFEIGLLFDPSRETEAEFCRAWKFAINSATPSHRIRFNEPYLGTDDGFTATLREQCPPRRYCGIELELRQGMLPDPAARTAIADLLSGSIGAAAAYL